LLLSQRVVWLLYIQEVSCFWMDISHYALSFLRWVCDRDHMICFFHLSGVIHFYSGGKLLLSGIYIMYQTLHTWVYNDHMLSFCLNLLHLFGVFCSTSACKLPLNGCIWLCIVIWVYNYDDILFPTCYAYLV